MYVKEFESETDLPDEDDVPCHMASDDTQSETSETDDAAAPKQVLI
jgi:hypothetical protein